MRLLFLCSLLPLVLSNEGLKKEIEEAFIHFDKDNDGLVTLEELK